MSVTQSKPANIHEPIPLFELPDAAGRTFTLGDAADKLVLVIVFTCNHCPYAQAVRPILIALDEAYRQRGASVQFVAINSNDATAYPEDDAAHMLEPRSAYPFPYLRDETQEVAQQFGAVCTPDVFVYDRNRHLAYRGRVNDNWKQPDRVTRHDLRDAIDALLRGERPVAEQFPSVGCSIKWKSDYTYVRR